MTVRTKSRSAQWSLWLGGALVALGIYVVSSRLLYGSVSFNLSDPLRYRLAMPLAVLLVYLAWETRWDGRRRDVGTGKGKADPKKVEVTVSPRQGEKRIRPCPHPPPFSIPPAQPSAGSVLGEELFLQARALPHQPIPDFDFDGPYLKLLGKSAAEGYAQASAKLGEYAMRRNAWVEAYFWMSQAKRQGMLNLEAVMRDIRQSWASGGYHDESENVHPLFDVEQGSVGRALLHVDSGREAAVAREFLKANHPECLH